MVARSNRQMKKGQGGALQGEEYIIIVVQLLTTRQRRGFHISPVVKMA